MGYPPPRGEEMPDLRENELMIALRIKFGKKPKPFTGAFGWSGVGYQIGLPGFPNRNRFQFSVDTAAEPERLFWIQPTIRNSF